MLNTSIYSKLNCPYCLTPISLKENQYSRHQFKIAVCGCDEYPVIENIIFLQKGDDQINRIVVHLIRENHYLKAIWICLSPAPKLQRLILISVYLVRKYLGYLFPLKMFLLLFRFIGSKSSRSWYQYLLDRNHNNFKLAVDLFKKARINNRLIVDIGSGIGHFPRELLKENRIGSDMQFILIDKSFLSLFISNLYFRTKGSLSVCCDIENGIPLRDYCATDIFFIDVFVWILNKLRILKESQRVLGDKGFIYIIRSFKPVKEMAYCGYGIDPKKIYRILKKSFINIRFYVLNSPGSECSSGFKEVAAGKIPRIGYSCYATKN